MAILSLIQMEVEQHGWMTMQEFVDIVAVSRVTPGPIGINCATYVGYTVGGFWGSVLATFAIVLPSLIIMLTICKIYFWLSKRFQGNPYFEQTLRMLRFAVIGLIASAVAFFTVLPNFIKKKEGDKISNFLSLRNDYFKFQISNLLSHPILLILLAGVAGYFIFS